MPGEVNCIHTKILIPYLERTVGVEAAETVCRAAGRSREYLMADHNWISLTLANELMQLGRELKGEPDEERFVRGLGEFGMDWKPREERSYLGTYSMGIGAPRGVYERFELFWRQMLRFGVPKLEVIGRRHARMRFTPLPGYRMPLWACRLLHVNFARFPTNWGLPRAVVVERQCAVAGADSCLFEVRWKNLTLGRTFWACTAAGGAVSVALGLGLPALGPMPLVAEVIVTAVPVVAGAKLGLLLRERDRRRHTQRLMDLQSEEIIYSNNELEKKFGELETRIEQLSLLIDLSTAISATLEPEKIYEQAVDRLVYRMGYQGAQLFLVDQARGVLRGHGTAIAPGALRVPADRLEIPLDPEASVSARVAMTGLPVLVNDVEAADHPVHLPTVRKFNIRSFVTVPLRVKERVVGVLNVAASEPGRFTEVDQELLTAVANHVALALDRAESFQTIEELSRGLEEKVRVRTEQLRATNEELGTAYRNLQATQLQLIQREKMASVGQLVAGVAHELNNPIGFVSSNVATLEEFVGRLRGMVDAYRKAELAPADRSRIDAVWEELKIDYALKYLDPMLQGIREGAERTRKIVRDLRVFARTGDDLWQAVDLNEELESSLTLLNHLLKDRVTVHRTFGQLPAVECVRSQIDQVFLNLLANAAQAIPGEGTITIETRLENGAAVVAISDTGSGIPADVVGRIFDPFFTTKPVGEGTGLGLSISYEIVKKHGGEITVASVPGQGSTFTARIPLTRRA